MPGQQRVDQPAYLDLVDDRRQPAAMLPQYPEAERVERAHVRRERGTPSRQLALGLLVVGDGEDRRRLVAAVDDEVAQPLGKHACLAGTGGGDDARRSSFVFDSGPLIGGQIGS